MTRKRDPATSDLIWRWLVLALTLVVAPLAALERARAACTPTSPVNNATVICSGTTTNQNAGGVGYGSLTDNGNNIVVEAGALVTGMSEGVLQNIGTVNNFGSVSGFFAIFGFDSIAVTNAGTVSSTNTGGIGIGSNVATTVTNSGTVTVGDNARAILGQDALSVINTGTITAGAFSQAISANNTIAVVVNSGIIRAGGTAISGNDGANVANSGSIMSGSIAIATNGSPVNLTNTGIIASSGFEGVRASIANVTNSGSITAPVFGINAATVNLTNTGRVSGGTGIAASGFGGVGSTITNSGTIAGTGGMAIKLSPAADTLTLLPGSRIIGAIDMGGGADTINIANNTPVVSRVSSFFKLLSANSFNIINFTGTINAAAVTVNASGMPAVQTADGIATLDPTAFGQTDRALMNFTGGISSLVQGRLGGMAANNSAVQVVSFAPTGASGRTNEAFAANSAMGYAVERTRPLAHPFTDADAPYNVWTSGFGGTSTQKGDSTMLRSVASAGAGVIGLDRQLRPDLLIGAFAGGGAGRLSVELNSQSVDTEYVTGGFYGRFDWISHFLDFTLQGGATTNKSKRQVLNDSVPTGSETATASYDSWYISPEIAYGRRYHFANGYTLTPMGRVRYLAGTFDGYNEAGSAQNLVVGRRTLHDLEERAEVELSKITGVGVGSFRTSVHGGLIALQRLGNPTINTVLIGQDLSFTAPGRASTAGVVAGAGFDLRATDRMSLFGAVEATLMSDRSRTAAAKAGLKFAF